MRDEARDSDEARRWDAKETASVLKQPEKRSILEFFSKK